ncbi:ankyrin repeat domain-containing protein [bacterium]|nr:ankyrin repeat domain-containing protein [bacterium]
MTDRSKKTLVVDLIFCIVIFIFYFNSMDCFSSGRERNHDKSDLQSYLIDTGQDVTQDEKGETPLFKAVRQGNLAVCTALLMRKADIDARDNQGRTPLHLAGSKDMYFCEGPTEEVRIQRQKERMAILELLLEHHADVNAKSKDGYTPLHSAILQGNREVAQILIQNGADVNAQINTGHSTLHLVIGRNLISPWNRLVEFVRFLLEKNADVNLESDCGETALGLARQKNMHWIMKDLEDHGAILGKRILHEAVKLNDTVGVREILKDLNDIDCRNVEDRTALYWACQLRRLETIKLLIEKDANTDLLSAKHKEIISDLSAVITPRPVRPRDPNPLLNAIYKGKLYEVEKLIREGADVNFRNNKQMTALHLAAERGHKYIAKLLIEAGALIEAKDIRQQRPLHYAVKNRRIRTVNLLLESSACVSALDNLDKSPLHWAAENGHLEVIKILLEAGADINAVSNKKQKPILLASHEGHFDIVCFLIEKGAQIDFHGRDGNSLLQFAVRRRNINMVEFLLDSGVDINRKFENGLTALHWITDICRGDDYFEKHPEIESEILKITEFLIKKGADVNAHDYRGRTPLIWSVIRQCKSISKTLIKYGVDIHKTDSEGKTPLYWAIDPHNMTFAEYLISKGAKLDVKDINGNTLLHRAVYFADVDLIQFLLDKGLDINAKNLDGQTPLYLIGGKERFNFATYLIEKGAKIDIIINSGRSMLHQSCLWDDLKLLTLFVSKGLDINLTDHQGMTPLHLAANLNRRDIVRYLIKQGAKGDTLLSLAIRSRRKELFGFLFENNADPGLADNNGITPLHYAAMQWDSYYITQLLEINLDSDVRDKNLQTPLHNAVHLGQRQNIILLIQHGADINVKDMKGQTPLDYLLKKEKPQGQTAAIGSLKTLTEGGQSVKIKKNRDVYDSVKLKAECIRILESYGNK